MATATKSKATDTGPQPDSTATKSGKYAERVAPVIIGVSSAVPMPTRATSRGSKSAYDFSALTAVGMSIAVGNKTAAQLSSVISNANKKAVKEGPQPTTTDMKDANGNVVGTVPGEPVVPHYFAVDTDPATDPDKATARIFRNK